MARLLSPLLLLLLLPALAFAAEPPPYFFKFVDTELRKIGVSRDGLEFTAPGGGTVFLDRIADNCSKVPRKDCRAEVRGFFRAMLTTPESMTVETWAEARPRLRLRVYDLAVMPPGMGDDLVARPLADRLVSALVVDSEHATRSASASDLEAWGVTEDRAFQVAGANHRGDPLEITDLGPPDADFPARALFGGFFLTSQLAWIGKHLPDAPGGWFVIAPVRGQVWCFRIDHVRAAFDQMQRAYNVINNVQAEQPDPFTDGLFWFANGQLDRLKLELQGRELLFEPTDRFNDHILGMAEAQKAEEDKQGRTQ